MNVTDEDKCSARLIFTTKVERLQKKPIEQGCQVTKLKEDKFGNEKFQKTAKFSNWNKAKQRQNFQRNLPKHINNISLNLICFVTIYPKWA